MRTLNIATCKTRHDRRYINSQISWEDLTKQLSKTFRTRETVHEYSKMSKAKQADIKDIGGFVCGQLKEGRRNNQSIISRSIVTLDLDFAPGDFWERIEILFDNAACLYSTHKHTSHTPKYRLLIPLSRDVTPDEYEAVARKLAEQWGIDYFDDTTYQPARMMFWPSTSKDGEYEFHVQDGEFLNPEEVLAKYPDWKDVSFWPRSSRTEDIRKRSEKKQGDPLEKEGLIGAFCKTYTIQEAIETFLSDVYTPTNSPDRYTYANGTTAGGLVIYDDKFAYSNHATDPVSGKLCNAFDLVRIHKFHDLDEDITPGTPVVKYPSWTEMIHFVGKDEASVKTLGKERLSEALGDFKDELEEVDLDWVGILDTTDKGTYRPTTDNIVKILQNDPRLKNSVGGVDLFAQKPVKLGNLPWAQLNPNNPVWTDDDDAGLRYLLEKDYGITAKGKCDDAISYVHQHNAFHPIRDYLKTLEWDGVKRLDTLFIDYLGSPNDDYTKQVTRKIFTAAVARVIDPGCKMDYMPVLVGKQGIGKSHILSVMGGEWFSDSITTVSGKEAYESLHGSWIIEMAELTATRRSDIEQTKQFISKRSDRYRKAYARRVTDNPRQCVFFGTTNDEEFLRDYTGNRRFWPVETNGTRAIKSVFEDLPKVRDQIWAEAVTRYRQGETRYLEGEVAEEALRKQEEHTYIGPKDGLIQEYLERLLPADWDKRKLYERITWLESEEEGVNQREYVCALEIWCEVFNGTRKDFSNAEQREIKAALDRLGWVRTKNPVTLGREYGRQRAFKRPTK